MNESNFSYRNLIVWQKAMQFDKVAYSLARQFPADEKFALTDQVRRAVVSIASNIAEGCGRASWPTLLAISILSPSRKFLRLKSVEG